MLYKLDESVGKVVQGLKENNMLQDSIIVFTTDNGGPASGFNQNAASNYPLKGVCMIKFIYLEKATKFCEISTLLLSYVVSASQK